MTLPDDDLDVVAHGVLHAIGPDALRGRTVLLTGGSGFVGRWLVESFCRLNRAASLDAHLVMLTRDVNAFRAAAPHAACDSALSFVEGDLGALASSDAAADLVIHAATESSATLATAHPRLFAEMIAGTQHVLDYAVRAGAKRVLYVSSGAVYGRQPPELERVPETYAGSPDPLDPRSAYGESKRASELLCAAYAARGGVEAVIARGFAFIGPLLPLDRGFAAGNFIADALHGRAIDVAGDGTPLRSYLYAADLAEWLWILLLRGASGRAYNVGAEEAVSIAELAHEAARLDDPPLPVTIRGRATGGAPPERYVPSTARARDELGLAPRVGWREALRRTYDWYRTQR